MSPTRTLAVSLTLASLAQPAGACRGAVFEHYILMERVPPAAEGSSVVAKVEILEVEKTGQWRSVARARVLAPTKGVEFGQIINISAGQTSCGGGMDQRHVGLQGFVAGEIDPSSGLFHGTWTDRRLGADPGETHRLLHPQR